MLTPEATKQIIDDRLDQEFAELLKIADGVSPQYIELVEVVKGLSRRGGKRLRPHLSMFIYEAYSGMPGKEILSAAAAQELLHVAMLIHDDFMDQDMIRYGDKNVGGLYRDIYEPYLNGNRLKHEADTMAILAGDLLQARGYRLASSVDAKPEIKNRVETLIADTITRVIGGQVLDTQAPFRNDADIDPLKIAQHKTASYTFETPMLVGAILAEAPEKEVELLSDLGQMVGIGYQLMDDLLGVFGDESTTGKSANGDIREGKRTLLIQRFDQLASKAQANRFYEIFGQTKDDNLISEARQLLIDSGARKAVEKELAKIGRNASRIVEKLSIDSGYKAALVGLVSKGLARQK